LQKAVQAVLSRGLQDPRVRGLLSVTRVDISPDQRHATVWVSVLPEEHAELALHGLRHATRHIQYQVARSVTTRRMPLLAFRLDRAIKKQAEVLAAIERGRQRVDESSGVRTSEDTTGEESAS
jgi:ribosome-binding factor A